jgi:hypothetical protein
MVSFEADSKPVLLQPPEARCIHPPIPPSASRGGHSPAVWLSTQSPVETLLIINQKSRSLSRREGSAKTLLLSWSEMSDRTGSSKRHFHSF